jgi:hypothetical protein
VHEYGAPQNTEYALDFEAARENLGITVYEHSLCDKIKVQVVDRTRETLDDGDVVNVTPLGKVQIAQGIEGKVPCEQRFAREALVSLKIGDAVYRVGKTNAEGRVGVNLAKDLGTDVYGTPAGDVVVLVRGQGSVETREAGRLPLGELRAREQRIEELVTELGQLLAKAPEALTPEDITRSYQLYAQLRSIAWHDSRFQGLAMRFWELWQNRKDIEAAQNLGRNLQALDRSKDLLRTAGAATIPLFAQVGINSGQVSDRMLEWARFQMLEGVQQHPRACQQGINLNRLPDYFSVQQQIAGGYLQYAYGDPYQQVLSGMCARLPR